MSWQDKWTIRFGIAGAIIVLATVVSTFID